MCATFTATYNSNRPSCDKIHKPVLETCNRYTIFLFVPVLIVQPRQTLCDYLLFPQQFKTVKS
jgi:hypothetical protein